MIKNIYGSYIDNISIKINKIKFIIESLKKICVIVWIMLIIILFF